MENFQGLSMNTPSVQNQQQQQPQMQQHTQMQMQQQPQMQPQMPKRPTQRPSVQKNSQPIRVVTTKLSPLHLGIIGAFLFYLFGNPELFSIMNKVVPGYITDYTGKVTQTGTIIHAVVFGIVFFGTVYFIQRPTIEGFY